LRIARDGKHIGNQVARCCERRLNADQRDLQRDERGDTQEPPASRCMMTRWMKAMSLAHVSIRRQER